MPYRVSAELHPMEYFSRLNIDFDDAEDEDFGPQDDDEPATESASTSASSSLALSSSSATSSSDLTEEQKKSTPDSSNHSIGTPETTGGDEESVGLDELFPDHRSIRFLQQQDWEEEDTGTADELRRKSCPDPHILSQLAMRYLYDSDDSKLSLSDSALVVEKDLASTMFHIDPNNSYGRLSYVNAAA